MRFDFAATSRPLEDMFTDRPDLAPFTADGSAVATFPFTPLPGAPPAADPAHGIYSFTEPDATDPRLTNRATRQQIHRRSPAGH